MGTSAKGGVIVDTGDILKDMKIGIDCGDEY